MPKRTLIALILMLMPYGTLADDTAPAAETTPAPEATAAPAAPDAAPAAGLGPQSATGSAGGSNADAAALQPAGLSPIQSTTTDSSGLTAPAGALQAPTIPSDQLKVLAGEADGAPQELGDDADNFWLWDGLALLAILLAAAAMIWRDRRRFRRTEIEEVKPRQ